MIASSAAARAHGVAEVGLDGFTGMARARAGDASAQRRRGRS